MAILRTLLASLAILLAGGAALSATTGGFRALTTETARRLAVREHPPAIPSVTLQIQSGARVPIADLRGKWLLVDFIYTRCPSYCVALGSEFAQLQDRLAGPIAQGKLRLLSISFDPARDPPPRLAAYLHRSGDRGAGWLAGRPVDAGGLAQLERTFGIIVVADAAGGFTHNAAIHLVDPQGRLVEILDLGDPALVSESVLRRLGR